MTATAIATWVVFIGLAASIVMVLAVRFRLRHQIRALAAYESVVETAFREAAKPVEPRCDHIDAVEVRLALTDEHVAWWCPGCETQFGIDELDPWRKRTAPQPRPVATVRAQLDEDWEYTEETVNLHTFGQAEPVRTITTGYISATRITANTITMGSQ